MEDSFIVLICMVIAVLLLALCSLYFRYKINMEYARRGEMRPQGGPQTNWMLTVGIISIAVALGLGTAVALRSIFRTDVVFPVSILTCSGIGLIVANMLNRRRGK